MSDTCSTLETKPSSFFIVGPPRAGTTLLRIAVGLHSQVSKCLEMNYVCDFIRQYGIWTNITNYHNYLSHHFGFSRTGYSVDETLSVQKQIEDFVEQRLFKDKALHFGAVVHQSFSELPGIFPDAKFIYLRRDPRDVARSTVNLAWAGNTWRGAVAWLDAENEWRKVQMYADSRNLLEIRYEDFIAMPIETLTEISRFLGLEYEPAMMEIEENSSYKRPNRELAASWKSASDKDIRQVEARIGLELIEFAGYEPSGLSEMRMNTARRIYFDLENRLLHHNRRRNKFGTALYLGQVAAKWIPIKALRQSVEKRTNRLIASRLK